MVILVTVIVASSGQESILYADFTDNNTSV